ELHALRTGALHPQAYAPTSQSGLNRGQDAMSALSQILKGLGAGGSGGASTGSGASSGSQGGRGAAGAEKQGDDTAIDGERADGSAVVDGSNDGGGEDGGDGG